MSKKAEKPHRFINVVKVPPFPDTIYTRHLDVALAFVDLTAQFAEQLPGRIPLEFTMSCTFCSFFIPCDYHRQYVRGYYDRRNELRKDNKADNGTN